MKYFIECCVDSFISAKTASENGASRLELCQSLSLGGLTPSAGLVKEACGLGIPARVMIRPRPGDFCYDGDEIAQMICDIGEYMKYGVEGFVFGVLKQNGEVDVKNMKKLMAAAGNKKCTFHRAFDLTSDMSCSLEEIIELGCDTILTSGGSNRALEGICVISGLVESARGRIDIMPGSGINSGNLPELIEKTGARFFHASASKTVESRSFCGIRMGSSEEDYTEIKRTDAEEMKRLVRICHDRS